MMLESLNAKLAIKPNVIDGVLGHTTDIGFYIGGRCVARRRKISAVAYQRPTNCQRVPLFCGQDLRKRGRIGGLSLSSPAIGIIPRFPTGG